VAQHTPALRATPLHPDLCSWTGHCLEFLGGRARPRPQRRLGDRHRELSRASRCMPVCEPLRFYGSHRRQRDLPAHLINTNHEKT